MRLVSILGDSISTYEGIVPKGYAVFYDSAKQQRNGLNSVYDTWWAKVNQAIHAQLCVNNSYSGSKVTGITFPAACSDLRTSALHTPKYRPEIILIYIGFNDFGNGVPIKKKGIQHISQKDVTFFMDAYSQMLSKIKHNYPCAKIVCGTLARTFIVNKKDWSFPENYAGVKFDDYNHAIRQVCKKEKCYLADIDSLQIQYETLDGSHPTKNGHLTLYQAWTHCLSELGLL